MLSKIHLIKGIMVVRREATLTFEPIVPSHCPSMMGTMICSPRTLGNTWGFPLQRDSLGPVPTTRKPHSLPFLCFISRTKFLSSDMLKIKHLSSKIVLFSSTRTIIQGWHLFLNMFTKVVNNNSSKFYFGSTRTSLPSEWPQAPTISLVLEKSVPTFAYRKRTAMFPAALQLLSDKPPSALWPLSSDGQGRGLSL